MVDIIKLNRVNQLNQLIYLQKKLIFKLNIIKNMLKYDNRKFIFRFEL